MPIKKLLFRTIIICLSLPFTAQAQDGYSRNPDLDILHYRFGISLNDSTDRIEGTALITFRLTKRTGPVELDLTGINGKGTGMAVSRVLSGQADLDFKHENNRIRVHIPDSVSVPGIWSFTVHYSGIPADGLILSRNKYGEPTFFGDNWPDRARNWLPCVDHPSDKATLEFIVTAPEKFRVVSNGTLIAEYPELSANKTRSRVTHWKEDVPLPTKVMVIGVADFAWETAGISRGVPVQSWVYARDRQNGFADYRPAADILTFYQDLIGPYAFKKLANVQSKTRFGGMENSGCIFYYEGSVNGRNNMHSLLAHEIAHQWFGDAVTEKDWHHIWLSEGFATYLEAVYADSMIPGRKLDVNMAEMRKSVIRFYDETHKPVIDSTITDYMNLLSTNSYQKGAWVLHMLRQKVGEENFWKGIRKFYHDYRDRNAMTSDFQSVMESASGMALGDFFHQWLEVPGQPEIRWSWAYDEFRKELSIDIEQIQSHSCFTFSLPVEIITEESGANHSKPIQYEIMVHQAKVRITIPVEVR
jgi:aminopeptidase N